MLGENKEDARGAAGLVCILRSSSSSARDRAPGEVSISGAGRGAPKAGAVRATGASTVSVTAPFSSSHSGIAGFICRAVLLTEYADP